MYSNTFSLQKPVLGLLQFSLEILHFSTLEIFWIDAAIQSCCLISGILIYRRWKYSFGIMGSQNDVLFFVSNNSSTLQHCIYAPSSVSKYCISLSLSLYRSKHSSIDWAGKPDEKRSIHFSYSTFWLSPLVVIHRLTYLATLPHDE